ncbi:hypothetical protein HWV62_15100 [Athelia sp. TMB]|nr:hypothetical protein HWV62_15100 [Athelia sp. TMB]
MHRCLMISEIVMNIAKEIGEDGDGYEPWNTLAKLARTCRVFSEPALDALWRVQGSLLPVLRTMPTDLWQTDAGILRLNRPIKPTDWSRFQTYAARIHHFIDDRLLNESPGTDCLQALVCAKPPNVATFFPHVHSLDWNYLVGPSDEVFQCMPFFMSAATKKISFSLGSLRTTGLSLAQSILHNFPGVRHLDICGLHAINRPPIEDALSELFSHGQGLCDVKVDCFLLPPTIKHLAGFKHLKRLEMIVDDRGVSTQVSGFRVLECLRVSGETFRIISGLIAMLQSPLETVFLTTIGGVVKPQELAGTFELMSIHCSHAHLRTLTVQTLVTSLEPPDACIDHRVLQHLFVFFNLSHVELLIDAPVSLDNKTVRQMAAAWPQLSHLTLGGDGWFRRTSITPAGLIPLFYLPRLTTLSISIDASTIDGASQPVPTQIIRGALRSLDLQYSIINDAGPMAAFLSKFAPNLEDIQAWADDWTQTVGVSEELAQEYQSRWKEVARLVPLFVAVREEERGARASS